MARSNDVAVTADTFAELTNAAVTYISFQNKGPGAILVMGTTGTTGPSTSDGAYRYQAGQGEKNVAISDLFPGQSYVRLWARAEGLASVVAVQHA
ncbi:MAG: hypothetical protein EBR82_84025 [Caulobacteraceae bacterium]|nr:hypothetical protein [Caulobacteraceae bacterium]